ncbi:uncharacterized protein LOC110843004 [Folsomia candida]|uniref:Uncharacterized protein n=1 Tax=Folsomia candida TaxID=158441 RepID=A0A226ETS8_FOLCA|nr:uncharacterized protein LOC110843004 [Folsomia candida]OXA61013.1 hypothetical protein Fcan01_04055 [Folsomia candida]
MSQKYLVILLIGVTIIAFADSKRFGLRNPLLLNNQTPFVLLYEHESFRGKEHVQFLGKTCTTLAPQYANWTSSIDSHRSCVSVCQDTNCEGPCRKVFSNQGISRLSQTGFNDNIQSLISCYF